MPTNSPATPLPWKATAPIGSPKVSVVGRVDPVTGVLPRGLDAAYIVHACNAYPQLVEAVRNEMLALVRMQAQGSRSLLDWQDGTRYSADRLRALLRSLGESA